MRGRWEAELNTKLVRVDIPIHCAVPPPSMAFRPLLRQVSSCWNHRGRLTDVSQRNGVAALAAAVSTGTVFAPRTVDAEERPVDLAVRLVGHPAQSLADLGTEADGM